MQYKHRAIYILLFLISSNTVRACYCETFWSPVSNKKSVEEFDFVALVKIKKILKNEKERDSTRHFKTKVEVLESFKGPKSVNELYVEGNHYSIGKVVTSCDLGMKVNDHWLIFGKLIKNQVHFIGNVCARSQLIRQGNGSLPHDYYFGNWFSKDLTNLRKIFHDKEPQLLEGEHRTYFENEELESSQTYLNNNLNGTS